MADTAAPPTAPKSMAVPLTAFAVGGVVALLLGIFSKVHDPTLDGTTTLGYSNVLAMKTVVAVVIGVLAVGQVIGALWIYGKLPIKAPSWLGKAHRAGGTLVLLLSVFVGYHCLWSVGWETGVTDTGYHVPARTIVHEILGCIVFGAIVVKIVAVRSKRAPGWFLPLAGGLLFTLLIAAVLTSAAYYIGDNGWPSRA
ncbi:hypothetical protein F0U44_17005 [Nocardioides humilatus]|uniref:Cytochrome b561 domain-containing protein n=1 Tax=Nocardioides humilatus TaxID=2607660 RepID=A0A5B1L8H8_9ACTN|nr:DUF6529 family protein [Nocardioides humilatus]KAA1416885.1 hypothetical protein F0U44_17005 [Nocardioides humilatus]